MQRRYLKGFPSMSSENEKKKCFKILGVFLIFQCFFAINHFFPHETRCHLTHLYQQKKTQTKYSHQTTERQRGGGALCRPCPPIVWGLIFHLCYSSSPGAVALKEHFCLCTMPVSNKGETPKCTSANWFILTVVNKSLHHSKLRCQWADVSC